VRTKTNGLFDRDGALPVGPVDGVHVGVVVRAEAGVVVQLGLVLLERGAENGPRQLVGSVCVIKESFTRAAKIRPIFAVRLLGTSYLNRSINKNWTLEPILRLLNS
jgi:hypothetical protein